MYPFFENSENPNSMISFKLAAWSVMCWLSGLVLPLAPMVLLAAFMVVADLVTGLRAARARRDEIHSRGLLRSVEKLLMYSIALLAARGVEVVFLQSWPNVSLAFVVGGITCLTEFRSILENIQTVTGVDYWVRITAILPDMWGVIRSKKVEPNEAKK